MRKKKIISADSQKIYYPIVGVGGSTASPEAQLSFERLLTTISTRFISISADRIDEEILAAQKQICEFLGLDISVLWQFSPNDPGNLSMTHIYVHPDYILDVSAHTDAKISFPWCLERMNKKEVIVLSRITDAPAQAAVDLEGWKHFGIKSALTFPLFAGDGLSFGALNFNALKEERVWSEELIGKLQIVSQIFANALNRRAFEKDFRRNEERLNTVIFNIGDWVWEVDENCGYTYSSPQGFELLGNVIGKTPFDFMPPDEAKRVSQVFFDVAARKMPVHDLENWNTGKDGRKILFLTNALPIIDENGDLKGYRGVNKDITQSKLNESERIQLRTELAHLARVMTINELSASLAHEINQPLGSILNNASAARILLSQLKDKPEDLDDIVHDIIKDTKRAGDIVRKIRGMVKKGEVQFEPLQINDLIGEVIGLFRNHMSIYRVSLNLELTTDLAQVRGDRVHLQQVLLNLITNALDAMKERSANILTIRSGFRQPGMVVVSMGDSGPGIDEANKDNVFKPFFTTKKEGLGFGLSICKAIIEEHGGKIWIENNPAGGATVEFSLKAWPGASA